MIDILRDRARRGLIWALAAAASPPTFADAGAPPRTERPRAARTATSAPVGSARQLRAPLPPDEHALRTLEQRLGPAARRTPGPHFTIVADVPETVAREVLAALEQAYAAHVACLTRCHVPIRAPVASLCVLLVRDPEVHQRLVRDLAALGADALGVFDPESNTVFLCEQSPAAQAAATRPAGGAIVHATPLLLQIARHEAAHQIQFNVGLLGPDCPAWLREGLATLFEPGAGFENGEPPDNPVRRAEFQRAQAAGEISPERLRALLSGDRKCDAPVDYALAWAAARHIVLRHPGALATLLRRVSGDDFPSAPGAVLSALEALIGPIDAAFLDAVRLDALASVAP